MLTPPTNRIAVLAAHASEALKSPRTPGKFRAILFAAVILPASLLTPQRVSASDAAPLSPALEPAFDAIRTAYVAGESYELWQTLVSAVDKVRDPQLADLNRALAAEEIPSVEELLADARLKLVQQGLAGTLAEPGIRERLLILSGLEQRMGDTVKEILDDPLLAASATEMRDLERLERELWDLHVFNNRLLTAARCAQDAVRLARAVPDDTFERLGASDKAAVALGRFPDAAAIQAARQDVREAELARRLHRLEVGVEILRNPKFRRERFLAAYSTQVDGRILAVFFRDRAAQGNPPPLTRDPLRAPDATGRVAALSAEAEQLAGGLAERSRLFFEGLHWWLRGRYGAGPDLGGLAKSAAATQDPGRVFWLFMPAEPPVPTDPADPSAPAVPACDRRHHFTWAWEDRRVQERASYSVKTSRRTQRRELPGFW